MYAQELSNNSMKKIFATATAILLVITTGVYLLFPTPEVYAWYDTDFSNRVVIEINPNHVDATLTDFPVYIDMATLPDLSAMNSDCGDVRVVESDDATETPREIVDCDTGAGTGEMYFKADSLSSSATTTFYIYYGNSGASDYATSSTNGASNVWTNYGGVWHMGTTVLVDSSGNVSDSTTNTGTNSTDSKIGVATDYSGSSQRSIIPDNASIGTDVTGTLTYTAWFEGDAWSRSLEKSDSYFMLSFAGAGDNGPLIKNGGNKVASVGTLSTGTYHHLGGRFNGSAGTLDAIVAGEINDTTSSLGSTLDTGGNDLYVGSDDTTNYFNGRIDELRISSNVFSAEYMRAEYDNVNTPEPFYWVGSQESAPDETEESIPVAARDGGIIIRDGGMIIRGS